MRLIVAVAVLVVVAAGPSASDAGGPDVPRVLYLNRCVDDCPIAAGANDDATTDTSSIADAGTLTRLPRLDLVWADIVLCAGETFASYDVEVVTEEPAPGTSYLEIMIAGRPEELGLDAGTLGAAPLADDCAPIDHGLGFAFGNLYDLVAEPERALDLCATLAHQAGHLWGLEHTDECRDVMRDRDDCEVRPWFVDLKAACVGSCACRGDLASSHQLLTDLLGAGVGPPPPHVVIASPHDRAGVDEPVAVTADVTEGRPLDRIELLHGGEVLDVVTADGTDRYTVVGELTLGEPVTVEVRAYDDLDRLGGDRVTVTPHRGSCAAGGGEPTWLVILALALGFRSAGSRRPARPR